MKNQEMIIFIYCEILSLILNSLFFTEVLMRASLLRSWEHFKPDSNSAVVWIVLFLFLFSLFQTFGHCSKGLIYSWYHRHLYFLRLFLTLRQDPSICLLLGVFFFKFLLCYPIKKWNPLDNKIFSACQYTSRSLFGIERSVS